MADARSTAETTDGRSAVETMDERGELLRALAEQRQMLLITVRGLDDARAAERSTVSELTLGGVIKHLTSGERAWTRIMAAGDGVAPPGMFDDGQYVMAEGETLAGLVAEYEAAARATDEAVAALADLSAVVPLPEAPWWPVREWWSPRRILLHLLRETAQHAGHADLIRESLDGASTTAQLGT
ncbi:DinB family protein [Streptomyces sp. URMC 123]|uniref:DinB family protein n=1 Tax=Streptomyces sp. URMC 123 TaxID=3423403 RepID=UPI003F1AB047